MSFWVFKNYLNERGDNEIRLWLDAQSKKARIKIDRRLRYLENVQHFHRELQYIKQLVGYEGIYEIRVVFGGDQYRPLGCYGSERNEFILLIGAVEKGDRLEPRDACNLAMQRKHIVHSYRSRICDHFDQKEVTR